MWQTKNIFQNKLLFVLQYTGRLNVWSGWPVYKVKCLSMFQRAGMREGGLPVTVCQNEIKQKVLTQANGYHSMKEEPLKVQNINELKSPTLGNRNNFGLKFLNF